jgi:hypothetical protein
MKFSNIYELALEAAVGNRAAATWLASMVEALHLWDDLIDKDRPILDETVDHVFRLMLVEMPRNPFFQAHCANLTPVLVMAIQNWHVANAVERGKEQEVTSEAAFILRSSYVDLVTMVATICGGDVHGVEIAKKVRALAHSEGFEQYLKNLRAERAAREQE